MNNIESAKNLRTCMARISILESEVNNGKRELSAAKKTENILLEKVSALKSEIRQLENEGRKMRDELAVQMEQDSFPEITLEYEPEPKIIGGYNATS